MCSFSILSLVEKASLAASSIMPVSVSDKISAMDVYRRYLLGKGNLFGVRPSLQPVGYVAVMPYPACLRRMASPSTTVSVGVLGIAVGALVVATMWVLLCVLAQKVLCWL